MSDQDAQVAFERERSGVSEDFKKNNRFGRLAQDEDKRSQVKGALPESRILLIKKKLATIAEQLGSQEIADKWISEVNNELTVAASIDGFFTKELNTGRYYTNQPVTKVQATTTAADQSYQQPPR